jgi:hypothetical protein
MATMESTDYICNEAVWEPEVCNSKIANFLETTARAKYPYLAHWRRLQSKSAARVRVEVRLSHEDQNANVQNVYCPLHKKNAIKPNP